jgi:segregation and condensation protein B
LREHSLPEAEIAARIEAALYSAGRPLSLDELIKASGTNSKEKTHRIINDLARKAKSTFRAIEIAQLEDGKYVFQLRPEYTPLVRKFAQHPLLPSGALKTLSYIAYEQPVTSKRLVQIRGSQVYPHIKVLEQMQFVEHENLGRLKVYRTTPKFQNYFGITDLNAVKSKLVTTTTSTATAATKKTSKQRPTTKDTPSQSTAEGAAGEKQEQPPEAS